MKPDFTAALGYMVMPAGSGSRNAYMAEMTMNLPWLNRDRHDGEAKQADAATAVTQADLEARTSAVFLEVRQAQIATLTAQKRVKVYRDTLLPQAEAAFKASTAAYQNNRAEFLTLIDSQNLLLDIQTAYYKALAATDAGVAELERAIGAEIPGSAGTTPAHQSVTMPTQRGQANDCQGKEVDCARRRSRHIDCRASHSGCLAQEELHFFATEQRQAAQPPPTPQPVASPATAAGTQPGTTVELSPAEITAAGVQVAEVRTALLKTDIDAFGRVEQPEAQLAAVSARIGGRVDKLYVQYTGERVRSGQPVADDLQS
jgi:hypothetical protein